MCLCPGEASSAYHRYGSRVPAQPDEENFFDGIDTSLTGLAKLAGPEGGFLQQPLSRIHEVVAQAILNYSPDHPEKTAPLLADVYRRTAKLLDEVKASNLSAEQKASIERELEIKLQQANDALVQALGIDLTALVTPGSSSARYRTLRRPARRPPVHSAADAGAGHARFGFPCARAHPRTQSRQAQQGRARDPSKGTLDRGARGRTGAR